MFIKYYGFDPLDISITRFAALLSAINKVEYIFSPKTAIQMAFEKNAQEQEELIKKKKRKEEEKKMIIGD